MPKKPSIALFPDLPSPEKPPSLPPELLTIMKRFAFIFLPLISLATSQETPPADENPPAPPEKPQYVIDLESLPPEQNKAYGENFFRANTLFKQKRIFECLEVIETLHAIYDKNPATLNLQGACYVEFRSFDKARNAFAKAEKASPGNFNVRFNMAEIEFVSKKFPEALKQFEVLLEEAKEDKTGQQMMPILKFKVLLCRLKDNNTEGAKAIIADRNYLDDTPLFYYGNAALAYHADKGSTAEEWLARARRIFRDPTILAPWQDTLIEFGYIKSFYGGDLEIEDGSIPEISNDGE